MNDGESRFFSPVLSAKIIRKMMAERGFTENDLTACCNVVPDILRDMESGVMPELDSLCSISHFLGCSVDFVIGKTIREAMEVSDFETLEPEECYIDTAIEELEESERHKTGYWQRYKGLCESKGISPRYASEAVNVSQGAIKAWQHGVIPDGAVLVRIADYFDCSIDYLMGRAEEPVVQQSINIEFGDTYNIGRGTQAIGGNVSVRQEQEDDILQIVEMLKSLNITQKAKVILLIANLAKKGNV